jgi:hypothetical protein
MAFAIERTDQCVAAGGVSVTVFARTLALDFVGEWRRAKRSRLVALKPLDAFLGVALLPAPNGLLRLAALFADRHRAETARRRQNDLCAPDYLRWRVAVRDETFERSPLWLIQSDRGAAICHGGRHT